LALLQYQTTINMRKAVQPIALLTAGLAILFGGLVGCQEEIRRYQVPRVEKPAKRMIAAIIPREDRTWYVKVIAPASELEAHAQTIEAFIQSLQFPGTEPIRWTLPDGWHLSVEKKAMRYATLRIGSPTGPELTISFGSGLQAADVLANVNRWRGQLDLDPITRAELPKYTRIVMVAQQPATLVDLRSDAKQSITVEEPQYTLPAGWVQTGGQAGFRYATFIVKDGDQSAETTLTPLAGTAGTLLDNVNRWREQLKLPTIDEAELVKQTRTIASSAGSAKYFDLGQPESAGSTRQRMLVAVIQRPEKTWFVKMTGPFDLLERQKGAFEAFVATLRFTKTGAE